MALPTQLPSVPLGPCSESLLHGKFQDRSMGHFLTLTSLSEAQRLAAYVIFRKILSIISYNEMEASVPSQSG